MKIKWLGHASFVITASDGTKIVTDPFGDYTGLKHTPINETADIVIISHTHGDHVGGKISGNPTKIDRSGDNKAGSITFQGIETFHDVNRGKDRGQNIVFCFSVDGVRICHLGDLGHELSESTIKEIGNVDIMMVPVGGFYTIDADVAGKVCKQLKPRIVIPMHYKNEKCEFPIAGVDEFLKGKSNVRRIDGSEIELSSDQLPKDTEIIVLKPAL